MRVHLFVTALLSVILFLLLFSATEDGPEPTLDPALALSQDYDYYMNGVDSQHFRLDGSTAWRLRAERLTHYPSQGSEAEYSVLQSPVLALQPEAQPRWYLSARQGRISETTDGAEAEPRVDLEDQVEARQPEGQHSPAVYTEALTLYPDSERASSEVEVQLVMRGGEARGLGMYAELGRRYFELLDEARGRYDAPQ